MKLFPKAEPNYLDFAPSLLRLQEAPPHPLGRHVLWAVLALVGGFLLWTLLGRLDVVAVAEGKLVPQSYVKIVQPTESGIVKEILVREGEAVKAGQTLMRMDAVMTEADAASLHAEWQRKRLALRRIDAELVGKPVRIEASDPPDLAAEIQAQYQANVKALEAAMAEERSHLVKARQDMSASEEVRAKLEAVLPHYREQDQAYEKLVKNGFAGHLMGSDKHRERIEKEQELKTQQYVTESARAGILQSEKKLQQIDSEYRRRLYAERNDTQAALDKLDQEIAKQTHRKNLLELKAPQDSIVKDLATHTIGTVVQPGTVLLTLVPKDETLRAEVWISNEDIGFVQQGQPVKLKFAAYPFQKYGMAEGVVEHVSADAADGSNGSGPAQAEPARKNQPLVYKALIALKNMNLDMDGERFLLSAGMQTNAEIWLGDRTVLEYLLSPVRKAWHEAGRER